MYIFYVHLAGGVRNGYEADCAMVIYIYIYIYIYTYIYTPPLTNVFSVGGVRNGHEADCAKLPLGVVLGRCPGEHPNR